MLRHGRERRGHVPRSRGHPWTSGQSACPGSGRRGPRATRSSPSTRCGCSSDSHSTCSPPPGVGQGADEQVRGLSPAPVLGRVGQLDPVPLIEAASPVVVPGRRPSSISARRTHPRNVSGTTPTLGAIRFTAAFNASAGPPETDFADALPLTPATPTIDAVFRGTEERSTEQNAWRGLTKPASGTAPTEPAVSLRRSEGRRTGGSSDFNEEAGAS